MMYIFQGTFVPTVSMVMVGINIYKFINKNIKINNLDKQFVCLLK